jgi:prepilin-type N-terminal cleavage/methylation domain-containing protein
MDPHPTKPPLQLKPKNGFSLIEILVTLAIIAFVSALVIPNTTSVFRASLDSFARKSVNQFREARDYAILMNRVVKIQFDLDKQTYWVEDAPANFLLPKKRERDDDELSEEEKKADEKKQKSFQMTKTITKKKMEIPSGLRIHAVISPRSKKIITEGLADIIYFPHGAAEAAVIHLEDLEGNKRSLVVHPITGKSRLVSGYYFPSEDKKR